MKSRLHRIEIRNFKAFREFGLDLEGRHLLIYGANGSGKSSLYWALYTFLQSARKQPKGSIAKYFDPAGTENLLNFHEQKDTKPKPGEIAMTLRDTTTNIDTPYRISQVAHDTHQQPAILKGDLASDFITYRFFFGFSDFRNSEKFNLWPLFEEEILPFCVSTGTGTQTPQDMWDKIKSKTPNPYNYSGVAGSDAYSDFQRNTAAFAATLNGIVNDIGTAAQTFYDQNFSDGDPTPVKLKLGITTPPSFTGTNLQTSDFKDPIIELHLQIDGNVITRPQSFLNEAKLTQLALSVRFAASLVNLHESDLKLLVLDDLLVSLDMSNRMKVVEILLSATFANYQKVILTHDLGFFQETRRYIGYDHNNWLFRKITGNAKKGPHFENVKSDLEMAQEYLANDRLAECGNRLRKCVEANLEAFIKAAKAKQGLASLFEKDKFASLGQKISEAKHLLMFSGHTRFAKLLQNHFSPAELAALCSTDEIDPAKFAAASNKEKGRIIGKLIGAKANLQQNIIDLLTETSRKQLNAIEILDDVTNIKDRILNPASHAGVAPIYTKEAEDAVKVIQSLEATLTAALAAL